MFARYEFFPDVLLCGYVATDLQYLPKFRRIIEPNVLIFRINQPKQSMTAETKALGAAFLRNFDKYLPSGTV